MLAVVYVVQALARPSEVQRLLKDVWHACWFFPLRLVSLTAVSWSVADITVAQRRGAHRPQVSGPRGHRRGCRHCRHRDGDQSGASGPQGPRHRALLHTARTCPPASLVQATASLCPSCVDGVSLRLLSSPLLFLQDRIVGELMQPGGVRCLERLNLVDTVSSELANSVPIGGYVLVKVRAACCPLCERVPLPALRCPVVVTCCCDVLP
jgi:hypothetical protein